MKLAEALETVKDRESFLDFVRLLAIDRASEVAIEKTSPSSPHGAGANGWENGTIESFLDAAVRWAEDSKFGSSQGLSSDNHWKQFAVFLYCGKIYE
jgi:hypothetical protein